LLMKTFFFQIEWNTSWFLFPFQVSFELIFFKIRIFSSFE
jgi:hypothetical protein